MDAIQCLLLDSAEPSNNWRTLVAAITREHHISPNEAWCTLITILYAWKVC